MSVLSIFVEISALLQHKKLFGCWGYQIPLIYSILFATMFMRWHTKMGIYFSLKRKFTLLCFLLVCLSSHATTEMLNNFAIGDIIGFYLYHVTDTSGLIRDIADYRFCMY